MRKYTQRRTTCRKRVSNTHTDVEGRGCWYEWWWVVSRDGSSMSVQCVLRVFKWVKSQLWLPDGGRFDPDHSDRPGLWCAAAYYWHYRETGIFLPNHFQLIQSAPASHTRTMCMYVSMYEYVHESRCKCVRFWESSCICCARYKGYVAQWHLLHAGVCLSLVSGKMSKRICSIHTRACGDPACLRLCSGCVLTWFWMSSWHFIINPQFLMKSKGDDKRGEYNGFIYAEGRILFVTSILSGRLNIVQTDRQKGIIPPLPSPPTLLQ